jgi:hypothetical protein
VIRLAAGRRNRNRSDQIHRWANCAAYLAHPPNGDPPPATWRDAIRYVTRRGLRNLSDLYAGFRTNPAFREPDEVATGKPYYRDGKPYYGNGDTEGERSAEWYTAKYIFGCLETRFALDPASPGREIVWWIPAEQHFTMADNGLEREWFGFVWLNPPYGRELSLWLDKFIRHGNGIVLVADRTSTEWWQRLAARADLILCLNKKIPFINPAGERTAAFPIGSHLIAIGPQGVAALETGHRNGLGLLFKPVTN